MTSPRRFHSVGLVVIPVLRIALVVIGALILGSSPVAADERPSWPSLVSAVPADAAPTSAAPITLSPGAVAPIPSDPSHCTLLDPGSARVASSECLACHARLAHGGHAYDGRYPRWGARNGAGALRPIAEVTARGLALPDERMGCVTCHDGASPWKYRIKLPPGAKVTWAVDLRNRQTYERPETLPAPRPGDDVGKKPLCLACHALD